MYNCNAGAKNYAAPVWGRDFVVFETALVGDQ